MATASLMNVSFAAYALIERCAPRSGGLAVNIGQYQFEEKSTE